MFFNNKKAQWVHAQMREQRSLDRQNRKFWAHIMDSSGFSKFEISTKLGVSAQTISNYLKEDLRNSKKYKSRMELINFLNKNVEISRKEAFYLIDEIEEIYDDIEISDFYEYLDVQSEIGKYKGNSLIDKAHNYVKKVIELKKKRKTVLKGALEIFFFGIGFVEYFNETRKGIFYFIGFIILAIILSLSFKNGFMIFMIINFLFALISSSILVEKYNKIIDEKKDILLKENSLRTEEALLKNNKYSFKCGCGNEIFTELEDMPQKGKSKIVICPKCGRKFKHSIPDNQYVCPGCKKSFLTLKENIKHMNKCTDYKKRKFKCEKCNESFFLDDKEIKLINSKGFIDVFCPSCNAPNKLEKK